MARAGMCSAMLPARERCWLQVFAVEARYEEGPFPLPASREELLALLESELERCERAVSRCFMRTGAAQPHPKPGWLQPLHAQAGRNPSRGCCLAGRPKPRSSTRSGAIEKPAAHVLVKDTADQGLVGNALLQGTGTQGA